MIFKKFFSFSFFFIFIIFFSFLNLGDSKFFSFKFLDFSFQGFDMINLSFCLDQISFSYFLMVMSVVTLVTLYSEFYMDHYNNKKYFVLMFFFFLSMMTLVSSNTFVNFIIGWDGLGISSLMLIFFYPNKTSTYNGFLTYFFNRLGDAIILVCFSYLMIYQDYFWFCGSNLWAMIYFLFFLCSLTKGAQFPLSSWLPAAMSAPTPISAMVHSSTLVTAGIFVLFKIKFFLDYFSISPFVELFSLVTFFVGGLLANSEMDLKKLVAFSTMSQISMVIYFLSSSMFYLSIFHMSNHAIFKTVIFCLCGFLFVANFSSQNSKSSKNSVLKLVFLPVFLLSIFSMTGLNFSSSFYSKDQVLEVMFDGLKTLNFLFLLAGSILTVIYSRRLLSSFFFSKMSYSINFLSLKFYQWNFMILIFFLMLFMGKFYGKMFFSDYTPLISSIDLYVILFLIFFPLVFSVEKIFGFFTSLNFDLFHSKIFSFSFAPKLMSDNTFLMVMNDEFLFKNYYLEGKNFSLHNLKVGPIILIVFFSIMLIMF